MPRVDEHFLLYLKTMHTIFASFLRLSVHSLRGLPRSTSTTKGGRRAGQRIQQARLREFAHRGKGVQKCFRRSLWKSPHHARTAFENISQACCTLTTSSRPRTDCTPQINRPLSLLSVFQSSFTAPAGKSDEGLMRAYYQNIERKPKEATL